MALQEATNLLARLKDSYGNGDLSTAENVLAQLKLKLIQLPALPPTFEQSPTAQQELLLGREVLEQAVLLSIKQQNEAAMERSFAQLRTYYNDTRSLMPASPNEVAMQGLNLLRLLVQNRIAEFHTELELIPLQVGAHKDPAIQHPIQLEQWLMEGAYNKVLAASRAAPSEVHGLLMAQMATTVRDEAASCAEKAYERLKLTDAVRLLLFDSEATLRTYAEEHGWKITPDGDIVFRAASSESASAAKTVPSLELINNALVYAKELERIV